MVIFTPHVRETSVLRLLWRANPNIVFGYASEEACRRKPDAEMRRKVIRKDEYYLTVERRYIHLDVFGLVVSFHNHVTLFEYDVVHEWTIHGGEVPLTKNFLEPLLPYLATL